MKIELYSVKDIKIGYSAPFEAKNKGEALRMFEDALTNKQSTLSKHPRDMELYYVGTFDLDTGATEGEIKYIASGKDFVIDKKFNELDEETLKQVLEELTKITEEQERERKAFVEIKEKINAIDTKAENNRNNVILLNKITKKIRGTKNVINE